MYLFLESRKGFNFDLIVTLSRYVLTIREAVELLTAIVGSPHYGNEGDIMARIFITGSSDDLGLMTGEPLSNRGMCCVLCYTLVITSPAKETRRKARTTDAVLAVSPESGYEYLAA